MMDWQTSLPPVLRSRRALEEKGVRFLPAGAVDPVELPIEPDGKTYTMAQATEWLDASSFAVGRWDGSLSVFRWVESKASGPLITTSASDPASEGVQMVVSLGPTAFATSAGESNLAVWTPSEGGWRSIASTLVPFQEPFGAANSGVLIAGERDSQLVVGHAGGYVTVWQVDADRSLLSLRSSLDLRNPKPVNPFGMHNIRGVARLGDRHVVAGSEDGFISVVDLGEPEVVSQTVYDPAAQRGINSVALRPEGELLVASCAVGRDDPNLWSFDVATLEPVPRDHASLKVDPSAEQVFNFSTIYARSARTGPCFFASTEEGALWMGTVSDGRIELMGYERVTTPLGSALGYQTGGRLLLASHNLYEFVTGA
jgi:hypothetical protein